MANEASGIPYNSGNAQNIGAVYFGDDFLTQHNKNLEMLQDDPFAKFYHIKQAEEAQKAKQSKLAMDLVKDLNVDYKGAMPEDIESTFKPAAAQIVKDYSEGIKKYGTNDAFIKSPEYAAIKGKLNELKGGVYQSAEFNKALTTQMADYAKNPDHYGDNTTSDVATFRMKPFAEKSNEFAKRGGNFLTAAIPNIQQDLDKTWNSAKGTIYTTTPKVVIENGVRKTVTDKTVDDDKLWGLSSSFALNNSNKVDKAYNALTDLEKQHIEDSANIASMAKGQTIDPKTYFIYSSFKPRAGESETISNVAFTPKMMASGKEDIKQDKANALYDMVNGIVEGNPDAYEKAFNGTPALVNGKYVSTKLNGLAWGTRQDAYGNTIPNTIVAVATDPTTPNTLYLRTDKDAAEDKTGKVFSTAVPKEQFGYSVFTYNYADAGEAHNRYQKAASKKADVTKQGIVNPEIKVQSPTDVKENVVTETYQPKTITKAGVPVGKVEEVKKETITTLKGDEDPKTLVVDKVYILDGVKRKWNGKNLVKIK